MKFAGLKLGADIEVLGHAVDGRQWYSAGLVKAEESLESMKVRPEGMGSRRQANCNAV